MRMTTFDRGSGNVLVMIIIIESGATKTDWCAAAPGREPIKVRTAGMNLATMPLDVIEGIVREAVAAFKEKGLSEDVAEVHFYAAGLIVAEGERIPRQAQELDRVLKSLFPVAGMEYASDLLAAARSVCGHRPGIAAIMGTGSNSCLFDGTKVVKNVRSAGYILGDEGGGARLGRLFMSDFLKGLVPEPVSGEFAGDFKVDYMTVVQNVYRGESPSKYLGSFAPWILERYETSEYVRGLVDQNFKDFIERALTQYGLDRYPVGVVGGFGYANRAILEKVAEPYGIRFSTIISTPVEGLVRYHLDGK